MPWSQVQVLPGPPIKMIEFDKVKRIVTHGGHAHRDDFLSVCFTLAMCAEQKNYPELVRRDPTKQELKDFNVIVLDVGEQHKPELSNFDHHQFDRDAEPCCALSLLLKDMTIYEEAQRGFRWLNISEKFDSKGPYFVANEIGIEWNKISDATFSPIEEAILFKFSQFTEFDSESLIYQLMITIGSDLLKTLEQFTARWKLLSETLKTFKVDDNEIVLSLDVEGNDDPTFALNAYIHEHHPNAIATVTFDDRGEGFCLYRLNDSSKIDFSQIESHEQILFAHKNGFVAKTKFALDLDELRTIIRKSLT